MTLSWIDPLRLTLEASPVGQDGSLLVVRQNFGSESHFKFLAGLIEANKLSNGRPVVVDLTPFQRLGNHSAFRNLLLSKGLLRRAFLLVASRTLYEDLFTIFPELEGDEISVIFFDLKGGQLVARESDALAHLEQGVAFNGSNLMAPNNIYSRLRMSVSECEFLDWIDSVTLRPPDERWKGEIDNISEVSFLRMPNGMLVTHFVLMKALLNRVELVDRIAYEVAAHACQGFFPEVDELWPELFVASSDHSYLIGAAVQRLTGVKCAVIDRIGLLPGRRLTRDTISLDVTGKRVALIVDVSATASEMERAASLLIHRGAQVKIIVCCVWLECAIPKFVDWFHFVPLCRPKEKLKYVYRSAP